MKKSGIIFVLGSINMDLVCQTTRFPHVGESFIGMDFSSIPGGKGANQAVAISRQGVEVTMLGKVGNDENGLHLLKKLSGSGVDTSRIIIDQSSKTGLAVIMVDDNGQNMILVYPGANLEMNPGEVRQCLENLDCAMVISQLEIPDECVVAAYEMSKELDIPFILDAGPAKPFDLGLLKGLEILSPNETEAMALTGIECNSMEDAEKASIKLKAMSGAKYIVMKLGSKGALLENGDGVFSHFPAHEVECIDETAAGDAFTAALATHYLQSNDIVEAINYANCAGALAVTKLGAQTSLPTNGEIESFQKKFDE